MNLIDITTNIILPLTTIVLGGGWFVSYRAYKRKAEGEAVQEEAEGWKGQQEVYQKTIEDLNGVCEKIRADRDLLMEENTTLREENRKLRERYNELENQIIDLRKVIARQGRKIDSLFPFTCALAPTCRLRKQVEISNELGELDIDDANDGN